MLQYIIDHYDHDFTLIQSFVPEALHFTMNDGDISTIEYQISASAVDLDGDPVIIGNDWIGPWRTSWVLRYGPTEIMGGIHTSVNMKLGDNYMSVAGSDWLVYFDRRFMPFDGRTNHANDFIIGSPPVGLEYEVIGADVGDILTAILDNVLGRPNSIPFTYTFGSIGTTIDYYRLSLADTTTILQVIKDTCAYTPGTAFRVTWDRNIQVASPRFYGDPNIIAGDSTNSNLIWTVNNSYPPLSLDFTNIGPGETHIMATGDGTITQNTATFGEATNQATFWRTDKDYSFTDALTRDSIEDRAHEQFAFDLNPIHEIPLDLDPDVVDKQVANIQSAIPGSLDGWFWQNIYPGLAFWIDIPLIAHHIDSAHHIVSMDCNVQPNGSATVSIQQNQIYDTRGQIHVYEG